MNSTTTKAMTLVGMGLMAGAAVTLTGSSASASSVPAPAGHLSALTEHQAAAPHHHNGHGNQHGSRARAYSVGLFQGQQACETAAHVGERRGHWDQGDCFRVGRSNVFLLQATDYRGRHRS